MHFRYATDRPSWYHQYLVYEVGGWSLYGSGSQGPDLHGLYEDRVSMMLDDGSVEGFAEIGGFVTVHPGMRTLTDAAPTQVVEQHLHLGEKLGRTDVRKFIRESREEIQGEHHWSQTRSTEELEQLREEGTFLDLWQWRAHRSNPLGYADNGYVLEYRHGSEGTGMYTDNTDSSGQPRFMFDPQAVGRHALRQTANPSPIAIPTMSHLPHILMGPARGGITYPCLTELPSETLTTQTQAIIRTV